MYLSYRENMRDIDIGRTIDRPLLLYGKIFSHRTATGLRKHKKIKKKVK